jgi:hypothetical protein
MLKSELNQIVAPRIWDPVPDRLGSRRTIGQGNQAAVDIQVIPTVKGAAWYA